MKIAAIRTIALSCKVDPPYASAAGVQARRGGLLVEVETDDGIVGIGESGISGVDIALWDIAGKIARLPVYKLLGACRDRVEAYASGGFYQEGKSAADLAGEAEAYRARGFKGMKMKVGRNPSTQTHLRQLLGQAEFCEVDPSEDLARVAAVRQALGPTAKLMVDVNCAWSPDFAIEMGRAMEAQKLYWIG